MLFEFPPFPFMHDSYLRFTPGEGVLMNYHNKVNSYLQVEELNPKVGQVFPIRSHTVWFTDCPRCVDHMSYSIQSQVWAVLCSKLVTNQQVPTNHTR